MSENNKKLKSLIRQYILEIGGLLQEEPRNPQFEYAFKFLYPNKRGVVILVARPKNKNHIEISTGTELITQHKSKFDALDKKIKISFIRQLRRTIARDKFQFEIISNPNRFLFIIIDKIFIKKSLSINTFYKSVQSVLSCALGCALLIQEYFEEDVRLEDLSTRKDVNSGLYL